MSLNITRAAITRSRVTLVALFVVLSGGLVALQILPRAEDPGFAVRIAMVRTYYPGANPERVEKLVSDKLEDAIREMPELKYVQSWSRAGISDVHVIIKEAYDDLEPLWDELREKVERAKYRLPEGVIGPFVDDNFGDVFGIIITITGDGISPAELKETAEEARDRLLRLRDTSRVDIFGVQEEQIFIEFENKRLAEMGLTPFRLKQILEATNITTGGGRVRMGHERIIVEPTGYYESIEELRRTVIPLPSEKELLYLADIANVRKGYADPPEHIMRSAGKRCVGLAVSLSESGSIMRLGREVQALLRELRAEYPIGIEFAAPVFQPDVVQKKVQEFIGSLLQSMLIVALVMLLFLGLRTGLVVAALAPSAMLASLLVMLILGIGIDQVSLASLVLALGMLVDNAIVMSESIMVQMRAGKNPVEAAVDSSRELRMPLLTSTLTTSVAFLPVYLANSLSGEYTTPLFKVVSITLLASWVLALTVTPLLCVRFIRKPAQEKADLYDTRFYRLYRWGLQLMLRHRVVLMAIIVLVFVAALFGMRQLPIIFFPPSDRPQFNLRIDLPDGTAIERVEEIAAGIENFIATELRVDEAGREEGVTSWVSFIGEGPPRFIINQHPPLPHPEYAFFIINTTDFRNNIPLMERLEAFCASHYPDVLASASLVQLGPPVDKPIMVRVMGPDLKVLTDLTEQIKRKLAGMRGPKNIDDDWGHKSRKLVVEVDQARARRAGLTSKEIAISLHASLSGIAVTRFNEGDATIPVILRAAASDREDLTKLENLEVYGALTGNSVTLKQVADIRMTWQAGAIHRRNSVRAMHARAELQPGVTAEQVNKELAPWLETAIDWPEGYTWEVDGTPKMSRESNLAILKMVPIAAFLIFFLIVYEFNSLRLTLITLATIPLAVIGVVIGLLIFDLYFGFMTLLGIISLSGIVVNNAIVLLERIGMEIREHGLEPRRAVIEASQRRLRPILLTTATTVAGMVPLYLSGGPMWKPMAIAIIFGLTFSTVLTLGVIPALYSMLFRISFRGFRY
jgi:multidrug efflux pump